MTDITCSAPESCATCAHPCNRSKQPEAYSLPLISLARITTVALAAIWVWFDGYEPLSKVSLITLATLAFAGWPIFHEAFENILQRRMTMELSMTIAIVAAAAIGENFSSLVITFFVLVAEELEHMTVSRGRNAIADLVNFLPREATVLRNGEWIAVDIDTVQLGDTVMVAPGENIAVDGLVLSGHSYVDQSRITGESMPMEKSKGHNVYAGSVNQAGALQISVSRIGRDTSFGRIIEAVEQAESSRAPVQKIADQLAGYLVYFSFAAAILTYLITRDVRATISVIIVAGACGVAAGTPLAILGGIGRSAQRGAIVKGGLHLETLGRMNLVMLDKTGTLTFGEPRLSAIAAVQGVNEEDVLRLAASAEQVSEHPLAMALVKAAKERGLSLSEPKDFKYTIGRGITADVDGQIVQIGSLKMMAEAGIAADTLPHLAATSELYVAVDGKPFGALGVADEIRPEARAAIAELNAMGIETRLLTGDAKAVAQSVARDLGIQSVEAEMLPEDKLARIRAAVAEGKIVGMMGDGINDAPALSAASIGIAMGGGTDVAKESADVVLLASDLTAFVETVKTARQTRGVIWQNFSGTLVVDAIGMALAAFGFLTPLIAAFIHVSSELVFILNSARLLPRAKSND